MIYGRGGKGVYKLTKGWLGTRDAVGVQGEVKPEYFLKYFKNLENHGCPILFLKIQKCQNSRENITDS